MAYENTEPCRSFLHVYLKDKEVISHYLPDGFHSIGSNSEINSIYLKHLGINNNNFVLKIKRWTSYIYYRDKSYNVKINGKETVPFMWYRIFNDDVITFLKTFAVYTCEYNPQTERVLDTITSGYEENLKPLKCLHFEPCLSDPTKDTFSSETHKIVPSYTSNTKGVKNEVLAIQVNHNNPFFNNDDILCTQPCSSGNDVSQAKICNAAPILSSDEDDLPATQPINILPDVKIGAVKKENCEEFFEKHELIKSSKINENINIASDEDDISPTQPLCPFVNEDDTNILSTQPLYDLGNEDDISPTQPLCSLMPNINNTQIGKPILTVADSIFSDNDQTMLPTQANCFSSTPSKCIDSHTPIEILDSSCDEDDVSPTQPLNAPHEDNKIASPILNFSSSDEDDISPTQPILSVFTTNNKDNSNKKSVTCNKLKTTSEDFDSCVDEPTPLGELCFGNLPDNLINKKQEVKKLVQEQNIMYKICTPAQKYKPLETSSSLQKWSSQIQKNSKEKRAALDNDKIENPTKCGDLFQITREGSVVPLLCDSTSENAATISTATVFSSSLKINSKPSTSKPFPSSDLDLNKLKDFRSSKQLNSSPFLSILSPSCSTTDCDDSVSDSNFLVPDTPGLCVDKTETHLGMQFEEISSPSFRESETSFINETQNFGYNFEESTSLCSEQHGTANVLLENNKSEHDDEAIDVSQNNKEANSVNVRNDKEKISPISKKKHLCSETIEKEAIMTSCETDEELKIDFEKNIITESSTGDSQMHICKEGDFYTLNKPDTMLLLKKQVSIKENANVTKDEVEYFNETINVSQNVKDADSEKNISSRKNKNLPENKNFPATEENEHFLEVKDVVVTTNKVSSITNNIVEKTDNLSKEWKNHLNKEVILSKESEDNISKEIEKNISKEAEENISKEVEENISKETAENISEETEENISEETEENISEETEKNISEETEENISKKAKENISEEIEENISTKSEENKLKETAENVLEENTVNLSKEIDYLCKQKDVCEEHEKIVKGKKDPNMYPEKLVEHKENFFIDEECVSKENNVTKHKINIFKEKDCLTRSKDYAIVDEQESSRKETPWKCNLHIKSNQNCLCQEKDKVSGFKIHSTSDANDEINTDMYTNRKLNKPSKSETSKVRKKNSTSNVPVVLSSYGLRNKSGTVFANNKTNQPKEVGKHKNPYGVIEKNGETSSNISKNTKKTSVIDPCSSSFISNLNLSSTIVKEVSCNENERKHQSHNISATSKRSSNSLSAKYDNDSSSDDCAAASKNGEDENALENISTLRHSKRRKMEIYNEIENKFLSKSSKTKILVKTSKTKNAGINLNVKSNLDLAASSKIGETGGLDTKSLNSDSKAILRKSKRGNKLGNEIQLPNQVNSYENKLHKSENVCLEIVKQKSPNLHQGSKIAISSNYILSNTTNENVTSEIPVVSRRSKRIFEQGSIDDQFVQQEGAHKHTSGANLKRKRISKSNVLAISLSDSFTSEESPASKQSPNTRCTTQNKNLLIGSDSQKSNTRTSCLTQMVKTRSASIRIGNKIHLEQNTKKNQRGSISKKKLLPKKETEKVESCERSPASINPKNIGLDLSTDNSQNKNSLKLSKSLTTPISFGKSNRNRSEITSKPKIEHKERTNSPTVNKQLKNKVDIEENPKKLQINQNNDLENKTYVKPQIMFTGIEINDSYEKMVSSLNGIIVEDTSICTHLVTDKIRRTMKFLCCIAKGIPIVTEAWLRKSFKQKCFLDHTPYILSDKKSEKCYDFSLPVTLQNAKKSPLLKGWIIYVTKNVAPGQVILKAMVEAAGGTFWNVMPSCRRQKNLVVISCEKDKNGCHNLATHGVPVVDVEFLLTGLLQYELDFTKHNLLV